jgi:hypothetical protein
VVAAGGRLELSSSRTVNPTSTFVASQGSTGGRVENAGVIVKSNIGWTFVGVPLTNTGSVRVEQGKLSFGRYSLNQGTIEIGAEGRLETESDFHHAGGRIFGAGYLKFPDNAIFDAALEMSGTTEVTRAQSSALFNAPVHSTGPWLITGSVTFNSSATELLGLVQLQGGELILNSPITRIPGLQFQGSSQLGGSGLLIFETERTIEAPVQVKDALTVRFDAPLTVATNLLTTDAARIELTRDSRWLGGTLSGNIQVPPGVVLELATTVGSSLTASLPFPLPGILRKTTSTAVTLSSSQGGHVTNRSLIDVQLGSISTAPVNDAFFIQQAGELHLATNTVLSTASLRHQGGEITGSGTIFVRSSAVNRGCQLAGAVSPGKPYGILKFTSVGFPIWQAGSRAVMDIGGTTPGLDHDQIAIERTIRIDGGTLEIRTAAGFAPAVGQEFTIFTMSGRLGAFPEVTGLDLPNGRRYRVVYEAQAIKLRVE